MQIKRKKRRGTYSEKARQGLCPSQYSAQYREWRRAVVDGRPNAVADAARGWLSMMRREGWNPDPGPARA